MLEIRHADALLDAYNFRSKQVSAAIKNLGKIAFSNPDMAKRLNTVIRDLEKNPEMTKSAIS